MKDYVLITAARNEGGYIDQTIKAVRAQTHLPLRWVIISDGSTDNTNEIVKAHADECGFIDLVATEPRQGRSFGAKAKAINSSYRRVAGLSHDVVGILDADITFEPDYYEKLLPEFDHNPELGISGGFVLDIINGRPIRRTLSIDWSVRGPVQTFRRNCFEDIGGYRPLKYGGIDAVAEVMARKAGWKVRTIADLYAKHHRPTGTENQSFIKAHFKVGRQNYVNGYGHLFMLMRCLIRMPQTPVITGASAMMAGYLTSWISREPFEIPQDLVTFLRKEQKQRMFKS